LPGGEAASGGAAIAADARNTTLIMVPSAILAARGPSIPGG